MATIHDPLGSYYAVDDKLLEEDAQLVREVAGIFHGWYGYNALRVHFRRHSDLTAEQRSRLAYYDDLIKRIGRGE